MLSHSPNFEYRAFLGCCAKNLCLYCNHYNSLRCCSQLSYHFYIPFKKNGGEGFLQPAAPKENDVSLTVYVGKTDPLQLTTSVKSWHKRNIPFHRAYIQDINQTNVAECPRDKYIGSSIGVGKLRGTQVPTFGVGTVLANSIAILNLGFATSLLSGIYTLVLLSHNTQFSAHFRIPKERLAIPGTSIG